MTTENAVRAAPRSTVNDNENIPPAERSGPAIINLLQQAADAARRNEERAKAMAQRLTEELKALEQRNQVLEGRVRDFEDRAVRAEQWLLHIHDEIQEKLLDPAPRLAPGERAASR